MPTDRRVHFEWGLSGATAVAEAGFELAVVVDVLSFSTAVSVGLDRGAVVFPFTWQDERASAFANEVGATLAGPRCQPGVSLSPASIRDAAELTALVLPSPNGSTISFALRDKRLTVLAGCLRNSAAVGAWLAARSGDLAVVAAGERWADNSLRPAAEDLWGAGAVLAALADDNGFTPEARTAAAAFRALSPDLPAALAECSSGRELIDRNYRSDVSIAVEYNASSVVPVLLDGAFRNAASGPV